MGFAVKIHEHALLRRDSGYRVVAPSPRFSCSPRFATAPTVTVVLLESLAVVPAQVGRFT